jgi:hypothetical protein
LWRFASALLAFAALATLLAPDAKATLVTAAVRNQLYLVPIDADSKVAPIASSSGSAAVCNPLGNSADPAGTCGNAFLTRPLTPFAIAVSPLGFAEALGEYDKAAGLKKLTAIAIRSNSLDTGTGVYARAIDPLTFAPASTQRSVIVTMSFAGLSMSGFAEGNGLAEISAASSVTGPDNLFDLVINDTDGTVNIDSFTVSDILTAEGWNRAQLLTSLNEALAAASDGSGGFDLTGFSFPAISLTVPADTSVDFYASDISAVPSIDEPSISGPMLAAGAAGAGALQWRRARVATSRNGREARS